MSLEQAFHQTIAHCRAGQWQEAENLYRAIVRAQPLPLQGQYWLSYIDALIQAVKPRPAVPPQQAQETAQAIPTRIRLARPPNPCYTARRPRWPWKIALGCAHVPGRRQIHLLLAHYRRAHYDKAEALARSLTHAFPRHDLGWKVLVTVLQVQGRAAEAQEAWQQRRICHASRRKNVRPA